MIDGGLLGGGLFVPEGATTNTNTASAVTLERVEREIALHEREMLAWMFALLCVRAVQLMTPEERARYEETQRYIPLCSRMDIVP